MKTKTDYRVIINSVHMDSSLVKRELGASIDGFGVFDKFWQMMDNYNSLFPKAKLALSRPEHTFVQSLSNADFYVEAVLIHKINAVVLSSTTSDHIRKCNVPGTISAIRLIAHELTHAYQKSVLGIDLLRDECYDTGEIEIMAQICSLLVISEFMDLRRVVEDKSSLNNYDWKRISRLCSLVKITLFQQYDYIVEFIETSLHNYKPFIMGITGITDERYCELVTDFNSLMDDIESVKGQKDMYNELVANK